MQALLVCELLLRRILFLCLPSRRVALQRYADNAALSSFAALLLQTATVPLQALASVVATLGQFWVLVLLGCVGFAALLSISGNSVYVYVVLARMYNFGVAPWVTAGQWLFVILDFAFRALTPLYNGFVFFGSEVLRKIVLPYSFHNIETLPEMLQGLTLMLVSFGTSISTWLQNVLDCSVLHQPAMRICGESIAGEKSGKSDCTTAFTPMYTECFANPNHFTIDILTPGLFARQAALALRRVLATHCGVGALVLNFLLFPLAELHLYAAIHATANTVIYGIIGLPLSTIRRCEVAKSQSGSKLQDFSLVQETVACTPDWQPLAEIMTSALESWGELLNSWSNAAALLAQQSIGVESQKSARCQESVRMSNIVLDAARAIEGLESVEALERLQGNAGLPDSETLLRVRVVGVTPRLFGVTDGKAVLYRGAHDGYVWAYGAWPFAVDVRLGLAAVSYSGSETETDSSGDARTGLLGCTCVDTENNVGFKLMCATAPYLQHVDSDTQGLKDLATHTVTFPDLSLLGMTCSRTAVRVLPLRWPRRRLANAGGGNYERFSYGSSSDILRRLQGDSDVKDTLQQIERQHRATPAGAVEAAIFVQPLCGDGNIACALAAENCFPWCMGVVRGGARAQNVSMYNAARWEKHVLLPDVDCGVARDTMVRKAGECVDANENTAKDTGVIVDMLSRTGIVHSGCKAEKMCTPSPVPTIVSSLVALAKLNSSNTSEMGLLQQHKQKNWLGVRLEQQPFVVAGDVLLSVAPRNKTGVIVVTRLYDVGHGSLQMASERLTLTSNSHAIEIAECSTQADQLCLEQAMAVGKVVLPLAFYEVKEGQSYRPVEHADGGEVPGILPAAASRWGVHWAANPALEVYNAVFNFCRGKASFNYLVHSNFGPALVWTARTMRSVDLEAGGSPTAEQISSRVSFMRVPDFFGDLFQEESTANNYCSLIVGLKIVGIEYINAENVLVTVLAARPQDYDPLTGFVDGPRTYRYYFLNPTKHDCVDNNAIDKSQAIYTCWRSQDTGMWPDDTMLGAGNRLSSWDSENAPCVEARLLPAFGSALVMPMIALVRVLETAVASMTTVIAVIVSNPGNPSLGMRDLSTVPLHKASFHSMVDSGGAHLFNVEEIISAVNWCTRFNAHLLIYALQAFSSAISGAVEMLDTDDTVNKITDKTLAGLRTIVIGAVKVKEGGLTDIPEFAKVEAMFAQPIQFSTLHASTAILRMSDGLKSNARLPMFVTGFMRVQASMVGSFSMILRLMRTAVIRLLQAGGGAPAAVGASAFLESQTIIKNDFLNVMRFQCYGLAQMVGATHAWGHALNHACLLFPDTIEGVLTVITVLTLDYPTVSCACQLGEADSLGESELSAVTRICLLRPLPIEETQWLTALALAQNDRKGICFATMDRANALLSTAFDKTYSRMYQMTQHVASVADALLATITGDSSACDAFDISPYVMSIIPEPVDYFSACTDTADCRIRCKEEYDVFEEAKNKIIASGIELGFETEMAVSMESMFFSSDDIDKGRNKPPFMILDIVELSASSCSQVCTGAAISGNRCIVASGLRTDVANVTTASVGILGIAYYCLPIDVSQYAYQWPAMEADAPGAENIFPQLPGIIKSLYIATTWGPQQLMRDSVICVVHVADNSTNLAKEVLNQPITQVLLLSPDRLTPILILRTSMRSERQLNVDLDLPNNAGFLHTIEHVQVDVAESRASSIAVQIRGYTMRRNKISNSEQLMWSLPEKACVRCVVAGNSMSADSVTIDCTECTNNDVTSSKAQDLDYVLNHARICLRERTQQQEEEFDVGGMCVESLSIPRVLPKTITGSADTAVINVVVVNNGNIIEKDVSVSANVVEMLGVDKIGRSYRDMQNQLHAKVSLLSRVHYMNSKDMTQLRTLISSDLDETIEVLILEIICGNARDVHGSWVHVLELMIDRQGARGAMRSSLRAESYAQILMQCNVHTCGACAHSLAGHDTDAELMQLENTCYAAKQCGVERCAGTLVNMRKPLCNLGNVLTSELHSVRVLLQALWIMITDKIGSVVELTHKRREELQIKWPTKAMHQTTCTAKDSIVSLSATLTSLLGAISHMMQDISLANEHSSANIDTRAHARYIMILAATTNMLTSVLLLPVYQTIVLQKFVACTTTDVSYTLLRLADAVSNGNQPKLSIKFQDNMDKAADRAGIALCLTEDVRQSLEDAGTRVESVNQNSDNRVINKNSNKITRTISDAISSTIDTALAAYVQYTYHVADIVLTWITGIIKGIMDIVQTVDWQRCKLPVVDTGMRSLGGCPCQDKPYSIPKTQKDATWISRGFWCSGLLMLNEGDGNDRIVWNPFSLSELMALPGLRTAELKNAIVEDLLAKMPSASDFDKYIVCMRQANSACEYFKPQDARLSQQGIEVMQVVSKCRENYKQARWDEAAVMYALFTVQEWRRAKFLAYSESAFLDDSYVKLRKKVISAINKDTKYWTQDGMHMPQWDCLRDALRAGMLRHDCHRGISTFEYVNASENKPTHTDACRVTPTSSTTRFPRMLWSGSSSNHLPISRLHPVQKELATRSADALTKITQMIEKEVRPEFEKLLKADFATELERHIDVSAFSVEGDHLHQLIDCVVLGPFAAAELNANVHLPTTSPLPVPLYHRGSPYSRDFSSWGETGGSDARQSLMKQVLNHVDEHAQNILTARVNNHVRALANTWLDISKYLCKCSKGKPDIMCCVYSSRRDIVFGLSLDQETWDISNNVIQDTFNHVIESGILNNLWLQKIGKPVTLTSTQISETHAAHLFVDSGSVPITTYGADNSLTVINNVSLWEWCTGRVTGMFATMPFTSKASNLNEGRNKDDSLPHVPHKDFLYDPATDVDSAPSRDHDQARQHSMEMLVDKLLRRAHEEVPHFWTHAHRYVASDSIWCENMDTDQSIADVTQSFHQPSATTTVPSLLHDQPLRQESVKAPNIDQVLYSADLLQRCPCDWTDSDGCYIPKDVCQHGLEVFENSALLLDGTPKKIAWEALCATSFHSKSNITDMLQMLNDLSDTSLRNCSSRKLNILWGLLAPEQHDAWYTGGAGANQDDGTWSFGAQHLASLGSGGLRLGMLSPNSAESMQEYVSNFNMGDKLKQNINFNYKHTIAQPVCNKTLQTLLRTELDKYFVNTLIPMAHSVQIVPAVEYCGRWVIEYAMMSVLSTAEQQEQQESRKERMRTLVTQQQAIADMWRDRCSVQMLDISICSLRGVYDIAPHTANHAPTHCAVAGQIVTGCSKYYYTQACLLYCDGTFYDPCLCTKLETQCSALPFQPSLCTAGKIVDGRQILASEESLLTSSMIWPQSVPLGEIMNNTQLDTVLEELKIAHQYSKFDTVALTGVFDRAKSNLLLRSDQEATPHSYCDDLFDYWPDVQHPVGYHATMACTLQETRLRGFDAWMSRSVDGTALIDPLRMRNASTASRLFGSAHLLCDAYAYSSPAHKLNPFYMQSKWNPKSSADPAVPKNAPPITLEEMPFVGTASKDESDTTHRMQGHQADALLQHTVGLVRAWAVWVTANSTERKLAQALLNTRWPHWPFDDTDTEASGFFLSSTGTTQPAGCNFPMLQYCDDNIDCVGNSGVVLLCLKGAASERGVCMESNTCFEHAHCAAQGMLCSGEGKCTQPVVRIRNEGNMSVDIQLFAESGCDISMQRLSMFDSIPDFAAANGMCSFRNWYHFLNTTADNQAFDNIIKVRDTKIHYTNREKAELLSEMNVLKTKPHPCDRSYAYTDYKLCDADAYITTEFEENPSIAEKVTVSKTWENKDAEWYARFCNMRPSRDSWGFLNPYVPESSTLHSVTSDIRRCSEYNMCPIVHFHVQGRTVDTRRVQAFVTNDESLYGISAAPEMRDYCGLDAQRCWGMGYLLGTDCSEIDKEESSVCVIDQLVLPLVPIIFSNTAVSPQLKLQTLRRHCSAAFSKAFKGKRNEDLFSDVEYHLTRPYMWTNENQRDKVLQYANSLHWFVFGMTEEQENNELTNTRSDGRGFNTVKEYTQHSQCAVYLSKELLANKQKLDANLPYRIYDNSWKTSKSESETKMPVMPGSSLYIFLKSVPVAINIRWFMQCVVLSANAAQGGVQSRFLAQLNSDSTDYDAVECLNYVEGIENYAVNGAKNDNVPLPLDTWLRTAPFLFTLLDSTDDADTGLHALQINRDVMDTISFAIDQLQVMEIPDLVCADSKDWSVLNTPDNIWNDDIQRYQAHDVEEQRSKPGGFLQQMESTGISVQKLVLDFLTQGTKYNWEIDNAQVTVQDLLLAGVISNVHDDIQAHVLPKDIYPAYEYVNLNTVNITKLVIQKSMSENEYVLGSANKCKCSQSDPSRQCRELREAEFSIVKTSCANSKLLSCTEETERLLDQRSTHIPPFLLQHELLYLVLLIIKNQILYTKSGGFMALHRLRNQNDVQAVTELFDERLPYDRTRVNFVEARQFNEFVKNRKAMQFKCPEKSIDPNQQTNLMHTALQQCKNTLQENIGWKLPASGGGKRYTLELRPKAESLLNGFYPTFLSRSANVQHNNFLQTLLDTRWELSEYAEFERAVCHENHGEISVMAPFWAEFFDVANNVAGEDSSNDPPVGCDMIRSSQDSKLMVYNTLCASSATSASLGASSCAQHPQYEYHVQNTLPSVCAMKHGQPVMRSRLGTLRRNLTPLCQKEPILPATCTLKHGSLHGFKGRSVSQDDMDRKETVSSVQSGFWKKENNIFRGLLTEDVSGNVPALELDIHDIGGHCMEFSITAQGWMYLYRARLTTDCKQVGGDVRVWLQNVEQHWAWDHDFAHKLLLPEKSEDVSWRCPLHWLQQYHDDDNKHQARGPSWSRNKARFAHITGQYVYAHPTIRKTQKLRGIRAARWISDTIACVATNEKECHSEHFLSQTLSTLLANPTAWHSVAYVPQVTDECPRVLDWPNDCGLAFSGNEPSKCEVRR
jgi:hypothetical protein